MNFVEWYNRKQYPTIHKNSIAMVAFKEKIFEYLNNSVLVFSFIFALFNTIVK